MSAASRGMGFGRDRQHQQRNDVLNQGAKKPKLVFIGFLCRASWLCDTLTHGTVILVSGIFGR